ncbi:MAG: O-antigen ligase family protein [Patescibacteria group bacterium]
MQPVVFTESSIRFRQYVVLGIFLFLIVLSSFFSGEWNRWLHGIFMVVSFPLAFFTMMLLRGEPDRRTAVSAWRSPFFYFFLFMAIVAATSVVSVQLYESMHQATLLLCYGIFFWVAATVLGKPLFLKLTSIVIYCTGIIAAIVSLVLLIIDPALRAGGLLYNANALGSYLLFSLLLGIVLALSAEKRRNRALFWFGTLVLLGSFLLTFSFTAWVSIAVPLGILAWLQRKKIFTKKGLLFFLIAFTALFTVAVGVRYLRSGNFLHALKIHTTIPAEGIAESFNQRLKFISSAAEIFYDHPLTGSGLATYQDVYPRYAASVLEQPRYAHNYYIQLAAEVGFFGVLAFVALISTLLIRCRAAVRRLAGDSARYPYALGLSLGVLASAIHALFDFGWHFPGVFVLFWIAGGIVIAQGGQADEGRARHPGSNRTAVILCVSVGLLLMARGITLIASEAYYDKAERQRSLGGISYPLELYARAVAFDPSPTKMKRQAGLLYEQANTIPDYNPGSFYEAERVTLDAMQWSEIDCFGYNLLGRIYFILEDYGSAERAYQKAIEINPVFEPDFYYDLAALYGKQEDYVGAVATIESILSRYGETVKTANPKLKTELSFLNLLLGQSYRELGEYDSAERALQRALEIDSAFELAALELAGVRQDRARLNGATDE